MPVLWLARFNCKNKRETVIEVGAEAGKTELDILIIHLSSTNILTRLLEL